MEKLIILFSEKTPYDLEKNQGVSVTNQALSPETRRLSAETRTLLAKS